MGCLEKLVKEAIENLPAFLDSIECTCFIEEEYNGQKITAVCPIRKDGVLEVSGIVVSNDGKPAFIPASKIKGEKLKELEIACLTDLKIILRKIKEEESTNTTTAGI
jgi:hypothetical protein